MTTPLRTRLADMASQECHDSEVYNLMQEASDRIRELELALELAKSTLIANDCMGKHVNYIIHKALTGSKQ